MEEMKINLELAEGLNIGDFPIFELDPCEDQNMLRPRYSRGLQVRKSRGKLAARRKSKN